MGIYACPRCGNPNGWWSGNMQDVHDCPGPPRRQWPGQPPELDWSELDDKPADGAAADAPNIVRFSEQAAAVLAALITGSAEVEYTTRPNGFWLTADNPSDLARALHDSPDALFRIAPAADEGGNDGR